MRDALLLPIVFPPRENCQLNLDKLLQGEVAASTGRLVHCLREMHLPQHFKPSLWSHRSREYVRHVRDLRATAGADPRRDLAVEQVSKNRFRVRVDDPCTIELSYSVYAHELTVRTSDVGPGHAYWNGACVFLWPTDHTAGRASVRVRHREGWQFVTQAPHRQEGEGLVVLEPATLDELVDAPCLCAADLDIHEFDVHGVPHRYVFHGLGPVSPPDHLIDDTVRIIEAAAKVFGDDGALPYRRYDFLSLHADAGGGGLEHTDSTTLLAPRTALRSGKPYRGFMGLVAHEHFHVWNVKRMRPTDLWEFDYEREQYTELLWVAEGFTAYYDDLLCLRAGVHEVASYLAIVAQNITALDANRGRMHLSLSRSSFDAWVRLYRPDEDTRNSSQNYYTNGALAAMLMDLAIRNASDGARSLDDAMRALWRDTWEQGRGYTRQDVNAALNEAAGTDLSALCSSLVDGAFDPDFAEALATHGVRLERETTKGSYLGIALRKDSTVVANVVDEGPAWHAGVCPGDELLGVAGLRIRAEDWEKILEVTTHPGEEFELLLSRRGVLTTLRVHPTPKQAAARLVLEDEIDDSTRARRVAWLGA